MSIRLRACVRPVWDKCTSRMMAVSTDGTDSFLKHIDTFEGGSARRVGPASELRSGSVLVLSSFASTCYVVCSWL